MSLWINGEWRPGRGPGFSKQDPDRILQER